MKHRQMTLLAALCAGFLLAPETGDAATAGSGTETGDTPLEPGTDAATETNGSEPAAVPDAAAEGLTVPDPLPPDLPPPFYPQETPQPTIPFGEWFDAVQKWAQFNARPIPEPTDAWRELHAAGETPQAAGAAMLPRLANGTDEMLKKPVDAPAPPA